MIELLQAILPYIKGLYTLPWIIIGFAITRMLAHFIQDEKIDRIMKKIGLVILYLFVPLLVFRIFLGVDFHQQELLFAALVFGILTLMYLLAYGISRYYSRTHSLSKTEAFIYMKTVLVNQGRSSAFVGGAMLAIAEWRVPAAIYMSVGGIFLFALIPSLLSYLHHHERKQKQSTIKIKALPWHLHVFPWYLIGMVILAVLLHSIADITPADLGTELSVIFEFFTSLTIPAALYYVGAGIHPRDLKKDEIKHLFHATVQNNEKVHWLWVRHIVILTVLLTPAVTLILFGIPFISGLIPSAWFSVLVINSILPITSTNMFLVPYKIDKKVTALAVTWTTLICVPIVVLLIALFNIFL